MCRVRILTITNLQPQTKPPRSITLMRPKREQNEPVRATVSVGPVDINNRLRFACRGSASLMRPDDQRATARDATQHVG